MAKQEPRGRQKDRVSKLVLCLFLCAAGISCEGLFENEDTPIQVEHQTNLLAYPLEREIVTTLTNTGKKLIGYEHHRWVRQLSDDGWSDGLRLVPMNTAVILEPHVRYLRPGETVTDTLSVVDIGAEPGEK